MSKTMNESVASYIYEPNVDYGIYTVFACYDSMTDYGNRKVAFYEKHHQRRVDRKLVISPMVDPRALPVAQNLGIEIYSYAEDVNNI